MGVGRWKGVKRARGNERKNKEEDAAERLAKESLG
jgi:hypothetical protein